GGETKCLRYHTADGLVKKWAQDVGMLGHKGNFSWAAVVQNISTDKIATFPLTAVGALAWGTDTDWHLAFDYRADLSDSNNVKSKAALGGELLLSEALALRGGATWDATARQWWLSAGIGLLPERGGLQVVLPRRGAGPHRTVLRGGGDHEPAGDHAP